VTSVVLEEAAPGPRVPRWTPRLALP